jgi:hypothetical protein
MSFRSVALIQSAYYVGTGLWSLTSIRTFEAVTGPKTDRWLVKTVGALVTVIGGVVGLAALDGPPSRDVRRLAVSSALALTGIDVIYALRRRIPPIFLLDAVAELALVAGWRIEGRGERGAGTVPPERVSR